MQAIPPLVLVALFAALAYWLHRSVGLVVLVVFSLLLIMNLGYWDETIETLALVIFATGSCMLIGVPVGIAAAHRPWLYTAIRPVLDLMQTIPTFVYLIPTLILFGLGIVPGLISTIIFAIPAPIRLTYLGVVLGAQAADRGRRGVRRDRPAAALEGRAAARHADRSWPGLTQCIMLSLSMVVIAALVGAGGLGKPVVRALNTVNIAQGFEAGLAIVLVAILLDRVCKQRGGARAGAEAMARARIAGRGRLPPRRHRLRAASPEQALKLLDQGEERAGDPRADRPRDRRRRRHDRDRGRARSAC